MGWYLQTDDISVQSSMARLSSTRLFLLFYRTSLKQALGSQAEMPSAHRHIPYLPFHKDIIREICRPQKDDLLIMAKGLGMRRIICALLKTYDRKEDLVLVVSLIAEAGSAGGIHSGAEPFTGQRNSPGRSRYRR